MHGFSEPLVLKWGFWEENGGRGGAILTPNELVLTFRGSYVCANFGENRSRNATVRVLADGQTHRQTNTQTQTDFIICPMLYAIAMGQIITPSDTYYNLMCIAMKLWSKLASTKACQ